MDIASIARSALQSSATMVAVGANNVANLQTPGYQPRRAELEDQPGGGVRVAAVRQDGESPREGTSGVDLASELVQMKGAQFMAAAQTKVLQVEDELMGSILDLQG